MKMQRACCCLLAASMSGAVLAEPYMEARDVTRAALYTGTAGSASISYVSLVDWLDLRRANGPLEDATIANRGFLIDDAVVLAELYDIANRLLAHWPGEVPRIAIFLKSGSSTMYGGEATRSNELLIEVGTIANVKSQDELAAVMSHELSHILLGHNLKLDYLDTAQKMFQDYNDVKSFTRNMQAVQYDAGNAQVNTVFDQDYHSDMARINDQQQLAMRFYKGVHSSLFSRGDEVDADKLAVDLLVRAGFSPLGLKDSYAGLRQSYDLNEMLSLALMENSKSLMNEYATEVNQYVKTNGVNQGLVSGFTGFVGGAVETVKDVTREATRKFILERLEASHPVPETRVARFVDYLTAEYGRKERNRQVNTELLAAYTGRAEVQTLLSSNALGMDVLQYLAFGDAQNAQAALTQLEQNTGAASAFHNWVSYKVYASAGNSEQAAASILGVNSILPVPTDNAVELTDYLLDQTAVEGPARINAFIGEKEGYFGTVPEFYPARIRLAALEGKADQVQALGQECVGKYPQMKELQAACARYAGIESSTPDVAGGLLRAFGAGR